MSFLCVIFGLFHGLAFLPVVLAMFGPDRLDIPDLKELQGVHVTPEEHGALPPAHRGVSLLGRVFKARPGGQQSWDLPSQHQKSAEGETSSSKVRDIV